jgi:hypothetical protein
MPAAQEAMAMLLMQAAITCKLHLHQRAAVHGPTW